MSQGRSVQPSDNKTFDLIVDGRYAEGGAHLVSLEWKPQAAETRREPAPHTAETGARRGATSVAPGAAPQSKGGGKKNENKTVPGGSFVASPMHLAFRSLRSRRHGFVVCTQRARLTTTTTRVWWISYYEVRTVSTHPTLEGLTHK